MGLPTNYADQWWLSKEIPKTVLDEIRDAQTGELIGYRERHIFTVVIERYVYRIVSFVSDVGQTRSSFNVKTGPDTAIAIAYTGKKFYCIEHTRELQNPETGQYIERQTWVHRSDGNLIPANGLTT